METTANYQLKKPSYTEGADVQALNDNADIVDAELAAQGEQITSLDAAKADKSITAPVTLTAAGWVEDKTSGWWTQVISNPAIVDGRKVDITFDADNIKKLSEIGASIIIRNNAGTATAYAFNNVPNVDVKGQLEIREVIE